jgi:hypothetical protein
VKRGHGKARGALVAALGMLLAFGVIFLPVRGHRVAHGAPPAGSGKAEAGEAAGEKKEKKSSAKDAKDAKDAKGADAKAEKGAGDKGKGDGDKDKGDAKKAEAAKGEAESDDPKSLPLDTGLPLGVQVAVFFLDVKSFEDSKSEFVATTDVRMKWMDLRHRYPATEEIHGYKEWRFAAADKKLEGMWAPNVDVTNRVDAPTYSVHRLRIFPNGEIELTTRTTARYKTAVDAARFPFDRQHLRLDFIVRENDTDEVELETHHDDVEWSRASKQLSIDGWKPGLVDIDHGEVAGWNGDRYAQAVFSLDVDRDPMGALAPVFIPLIASLLIPLLATWMNEAHEDGEFEVEAFELANVVIGGLFSVIALSFAIYSAYGVIAGGDNTVTRLFALNYVCLALALGVVVLFFRFKLPAKLFGPYVQAELFRVVLWALPVLSAATSVAFILAAHA